MSGSPAGCCHLAGAAEISHQRLQAPHPPRWGSAPGSQRVPRDPGSTQRYGGPSPGPPRACGRPRAMRLSRLLPAPTPRSALPPRRETPATAADGKWDFSPACEPRFSLLLLRACSVGNTCCIGNRRGFRNGLPSNTGELCLNCVLKKPKAPSTEKNPASNNNSPVPLFTDHVLKRVEKNNSRKKKTKRVVRKKTLIKW